MIAILYEMQSHYNWNRICNENFIIWELLKFILTCNNKSCLRNQIPYHAFYIFSIWKTLDKIMLISKGQQIYYFYCCIHTMITIWPESDLLLY